MGDALIRIEGLSVFYGTPSGAKAALSDVSLSVEPGERAAIVGESGSGKSTLALAIGGFLGGTGAIQSARRFEFDGRAMPLEQQGRLPLKRPGLSIVFQDAMTSLDMVWTVGSQLAGVLRTGEPLDRRAVRERAREWLHRVGLDDTERILRARPYELSGGMRQRVMLAIALCTRPKLLIADEPTSALDAALARDMMQLMSDLTAELATSLIIISHDIELCRNYADRLVIFRHGRIVEDLPAATLAQSARHPYTRGLIRCIPTLDSIGLDVLPTLEGLADIPADDERVAS